MERIRENPVHTIAKELVYAEKNKERVENQQRIYEERLAKAESLARGLGNGRTEIGPVCWWFTEDGDFRWEVKDIQDHGDWVQRELPNWNV